MREFEKPEIIKSKCIICGCKNKRHIELLNKNKEFTGYALICCGCGNKNEFIFNNINTMKIGVPRIMYTGKVTCIQPSRCTHNECDFYKKKHEDSLNTFKNIQNIKNKEDSKIKINIEQNNLFL